MNFIIKAILLLSVVCAINAQQYTKFTFQYAPTNMFGCNSTHVYEIENNCSFIKCNSNSAQEPLGLRFEDGQYHAVFYASQQTQCVIPATLGVAYDEAYFDCLPNGAPINYSIDYIFTCGN